VVLLLAVVGLEVVLQHTPRAVMAEPPSYVIFPPDEAVALVIEEMAVVVSCGADDAVIKLTSSL
jgi:hypothetical protein